MFMDQEKIGKFIKQKRTEKKLTQSELANMLNITDRAISKWENGICMPDVGIIPDLCNILNFMYTNNSWQLRVQIKETFCAIVGFLRA